MARRTQKKKEREGRVVAGYSGRKRAEKARDIYVGIYDAGGVQRAEPIPRTKGRTPSAACARLVSRLGDSKTGTTVKGARGRQYREGRLLDSQHTTVKIRERESHIMYIHIYMYNIRMHVSMYVLGRMPRMATSTSTLSSFFFFARG